MTSAPVTGNTGNYLATLSRSQQVVAQLQQLYGSMRPDSLQVLRKAFYSFQTYPTAGASQLNFFGSAVGNAGQTNQDTNMPLAGTFGTSAFLIKSVQLSIQIDLSEIGSFDGTDASTLAAEYLAGFVQAGVFQLDINGKNFIQILKPFMFAPPADGEITLHTAGQFAVATDQYPNVDLQRRTENVWIQDPEIFIEAQTNFSAKVTFDSGPIGLIITTLTTAGLVPRVGVRLDGLQFRPTQ